MKVYVHTKVEKTLSRLQDQENTPAFAARKAQQIIDALADGIKPADAGKLSKNGDARIPKCVKYDLGKGYRMVCVKERTAIYILYTGSHDSCHTWIDKNRNLKLDQFMAFLNPYHASRKTGYAHTKRKDRRRKEADYDELLMERITQKDLRMIFQGLT